MDTKVIPQPPGSLWRNRDYLLLWLGQTVSSLGTSCTQFAFPLLMVGLTRSIAAAGQTRDDHLYLLLDGVRGEHSPGAGPSQRTTAAASPLRHRLWPGSHFAVRRAGRIGSTGMGRAKEPAHHSSRTERVDRWLLRACRTRAGQLAL